MKAIALVKDLFFRVKIAETAKLVGAETGFADFVEEFFGAQLVLVDLEQFGAKIVLEIREKNPAVKIVGFLSHVQIGLKKQAIVNGCDLVLARSDFGKRLPELLAK
ncbi:MAG: hypothetical protein HYW50_00435 [Candidatus Diapherotrites archaeon]|nr:hypothetical protein [Candidatus Diapherotrites archaeon]